MGKLEKLITEYRNLNTDRLPDFYTDSAGCSYDSKADYFIIGMLGFCCCGDPDSNLEYIRDSLNRFVRLPCSDDDLEAIRDLPEPESSAMLFLMYWADSLGITEHGTSIFYSWFTAEGLEFMQILDEVITELENE